MSDRYAYAWEFRIAAGRRQDFEQAYGPDGAWVALVRQAPGYIESLLLRDGSDPLRYVTIDRWQDEASYRTFLVRYSDQYARLDEHCAELTTHERSLWHFTEVAA